MKAHEIDLKSFLSLAILRVAYGELNGVFRKDNPDEVLFDVYLPDENSEDGKRWIGQVILGTANPLEVLGKLHRSCVLQQWHRRLEARKTSGEALADQFYPAPPRYLLDRYRQVNWATLADEVKKSLVDPRKFQYRGAATAFGLYAEFELSPYGVKVDLVPQRRVLILTDQDGARETATLKSIDPNEILDRIEQFLAGQGIVVTGKPAIAEAA